MVAGGGGGNNNSVQGRLEISNCVYATRGGGVIVFLGGGGEKNQ